MLQKGINNARAEHSKLIKYIEETLQQPIEKLLESLNHIKCCKDTFYRNFNLDTVQLLRWVHAVFVFKDSECNLPRCYSEKKYCANI